MALNLREKMLSFWRVSKTEGQLTNVATSTETTRKGPHENDMEAALLEMSSIFKRKCSKSIPSAVWNKNHSMKTTANRLLLSKLKSAKILLAESYNFFQTNSLRPLDESYNVNWSSISENYPRVMQQVKIVGKSLECNNAKLPNYGNVPRIYVIAQEIISATGGDFDIKLLIDCLQRFQRKINLNLEELRTIPVILQLIIIQHIGHTVASVAMRSIFSKNSQATPPTILKELLTMVENLDLSKWESDFLFKIGAQIEESLKDFHFVIPCAGSSIVDISFSLKTLSLLSSLEWDEIGFVENLSIIDRIFEENSGNNFRLLDRSTKSRYRSAVHQICKNSLKSEEEVATLVVQLSEKCRTDNLSDTSHKRDIGYYLIDDGLPLLQKLSEIKLSALCELQQLFCRNAIISVFHYIKGILFVSLSLSFLFSQCFRSEYSDRYACHVLAFLCTFLVSTQWATEIINYFATKLFTPNLLPRFDFSETGIPKKLRTICVIPCLISDFESINSLISKLEIRFVGNKDENLCFALLTDFEDSYMETLPTDQPLLEHLKAKIDFLNRKYSKFRNDGSSIFYTFHRPRVYNVVDNVWMGYERKRGKIEAFCNFLRGIEMDKFSFVVGDVSKIKFVKYIITLDADTTLPRDVACKLIGTMAHPLNIPVYDNENRSIVRGYGILQPRISLSSPTASSTAFSKIFSPNAAGLDQYTHAIPNVYQDLFDESSYIGKGIFDVDAFQRILTRRFQDNRILSHDLLEGNFMRTGFVGDIQLNEDFPQSYVSDLQRRHRWIRGDWQNVDFLADKNLSALLKWKIFDNLRRSLVPIFELLTFLFYWQTFPILFLLGMRLLFALLLRDLISFFNLFFNFNRKSKYVLQLPRRQDLNESIASIWRSALLFSFEISCLPNEALHSFDAIVRTIFRRLISKRNLLEWIASRSSRLDSGQKFKKNLRTMWSGSLIFVAIIVSMKTDTILFPILLGWGLSPVFAWCLSQSPKIEPKKSVLSDDNVSYLRRIARKTWSYFEQFNTSEENYLPPDNYREFPNEAIAHRTSPTNIGLAILSNLSAYDFGYLSCTEMIQRISNTMSTLQKLEKYHGHFYNWYDTRSTDALPPKYVSSVDSGNLVASLLVLRQGLLALQHERFISIRMFEGLLDTLRLSFDELKPQFLEVGLQLQSTLMEAITNENSLSDMFSCLRSMRRIASEISDSRQQFVWFEKFENRLATAETELTTFAPWLLLDEIPKVFVENSDYPTTIRDLAEYRLMLKPQLDESINRLEDVTEVIQVARENALQIVHSLEHIAKECENLTDRMEYDFLYDSQRKLLRIGYNVDKNLPDNSYYDLLASEARLGIFAAIALGKIPQESWLKLGRKLTKNSKVLQSWTGSMFEYLMPQLLMPTFEHTLLSKTFKEIVRIQIDYGLSHCIPWGISESACSSWLTSAQDYLYRPAGIKELSLDPMLENSFTIAPYASMLAMMICPREACLNLRDMSSQEFEGTYGFYEAGDFTSNSLLVGEASSECKKVVRSYMVHHQAMSLLALENVLLDERMQRRFEFDPNFQSCLILLQ